MRALPLGPFERPAPSPLAALCCPVPFSPSSQVPPVPAPVPAPAYHCTCLCAPLCAVLPYTLEIRLHPCALSIRELVYADSGDTVLGDIDSLRRALLLPCSCCPAASVRTPRLYPHGCMSHVLQRLPTPAPPLIPAPMHNVSRRPFLPVLLGAFPSYLGLGRD